MVPRPAAEPGESIHEGSTLAIGVLLVAIAVILVIEMKSPLIGEAATPGSSARSRRASRGRAT